MKKFFLLFLAGILCFSISNAKSGPRVLIFTRTTGFRHASIEEGRKVIARICLENNIAVDSTEDAAAFNDNTLKKYDALIFLNTTGDLLNKDQQEAFIRYIHSGGTWIGIHAATDAEYDWPWYSKLTGAYFKSHPAQQDAIVKVVDKSNPATSMLPSEWKRFDEWYNFKNMQPDLNVLAYLDESSYKGGGMNGDHPIIWYHEYEGGLAFYTGFGHTDETFHEPLIQKHLQGAILFVINWKK